MRQPWEGFICAVKNIPKIVQYEGHHPLKRRMNLESSQQQGHIEDISFGQDIGEYNWRQTYSMKKFCPPCTSIVNSKFKTTSSTHTYKIQGVKFFIIEYV